ncbi:hypothetical protein B5S31_g498 [[Candida] boidinii]|nr:hypothetical protein B5S31_g498 [[Candida] boidinii]OWB77724.1 hypothetical protein B5S32_g1899 [[Candida] boidinii]
MATALTATTTTVPVTSRKLSAASSIGSRSRKNSLHINTEFNNYTNSSSSSQNHTSSNSSTHNMKNRERSSTTGLSIPSMLSENSPSGMDALSPEVQSKAVFQLGGINNNTNNNNDDTYSKNIILTDSSPIDDALNSLILDEQLNSRNVNNTDIYRKLPNDYRIIVEKTNKFTLNLVNIIKRLYYEYLRNEIENKHLSKITDLNWSFKPNLIHFKNLNNQQIMNYLVIFIDFSFVFYILPISIFLKFFIISILSLLFTIPILSQFFIFSGPILAWVFLFFSSPVIPKEWKPPISVKVLPAIETIIYGDNLSDILAVKTNSILDVFAWIPYGLLHFAGPFIVAALIFLFGPPTALRSFGFAFGYMSLTGVIIQTIFPAAPPWYKNLYGLLPANYFMKGSAGGLSRIDKLIGFDLYSTNFKNSPLIFGAFPSLHSGFATMNCLWLSYLFPNYTKFFAIYICWLWWSTMYLTHHYFFDVTAGSILALTFFLYVKYYHLPVKVEKNYCRWSYTKIEKIDILKEDPLIKLSFNSINENNDIEMNEFNSNNNITDDEFDN